MPAATRPRGPSGAFGTVAQGRHDTLLGEMRKPNPIMTIENGPTQPSSDLFEIGTTQPAADAAAPDQPTADSAAPVQPTAPEAAAPDRPVAPDEGELQDFDSLIGGYLEGIVQ